MKMKRRDKLLRRGRTGNACREEEKKEGKKEVKHSSNLITQINVACRERLPRETEGLLHCRTLHTLMLMDDCPTLSLLSAPVTLAHPR